MSKEGKELKEAQYQERRWTNQGGIIHDVMQLLSSLSSINDHKMSDFEKKKLAESRKHAMRVVVNALRPVLEELNDESRKYWAMDPGNFMTIDEVKKLFNEGK